ncbi:hypothetical protein TorRG33x02_110700 [Trema orientale]|uniref:Uncharacterized protein n=1 Tax=Trema orientale TaxID=63057 RepID=A0A2P5F5W2_TREOI|nr:hypothetical protein TorRG33x02_110700 [Trema orientale]
MLMMRTPILVTFVLILASKNYCIQAADKGDESLHDLEDPAGPSLKVTNRKLIEDHDQQLKNDVANKVNAGRVPIKPNCFYRSRPPHCPGIDHDADYGDLGDGGDLCGRRRFRQPPDHDLPYKP